MGAAWVQRTSGDGASFERTKQRCTTTRVGSATAVMMRPEMIVSVKMS